MEGNLRVNKTKLQEIIEQLSEKDQQFKNKEKEVDNLKSDIKKIELRFEKQCKRTKEFQDKYNESQLQI